MQGKDSGTVNFDDQDWYLDEGSSRPQPDSAGGWQVAAAVAVGIVIGGALMWAVDHGSAWQDTPPPVLATEAQRPVVEPKAIATEPTEPTRVGAPIDRQGPLPASAPTPVAVRRPAATPPNAEAKAELALRMAQRAAERKERAWASFYSKPADCDDSPPKADIVECANHFIRAKREFEQLYAAGKPAPAKPAAVASPQARGPDSVAAARSASVAISTPQAMPRPSASRSAHSPERPGTRICSNSIRPP